MSEGEGAETRNLLDWRAARPLTRPLKRLWKRYLRWPVPLWRLRGYARLALAGHQFRCVVDDATLWWAWRIRTGRLESSAHRFLQDALKPGDIFFDIGAYVGEYTLLAARLVEPGGRVYAFEPDPVARGILERNIAANGLANVTVVPYAVTDREGSAWLAGPAHLDPSSAGLGTSAASLVSDGGAVQVDAVTLTGFCRRHGVSPSVLKINVNGEEPKILAEGADVMRRTRLLIVNFDAEVLRHAGVDPAAFYQSLFELGRRVRVVYQQSKEGPQPGRELTRSDVPTGRLKLALI